MAVGGNSTILQIIAKFAVDKGSQAQAKAAIRDVEGAAGRGAGGSLGGAVTVKAPTVRADFADIAETVADYRRTWNASLEQAAESLSLGPQFTQTGKVWSATRDEIIASAKAAEQFGMASNSAAASVKNIETTAKSTEKAVKGIAKQGSSMMMGMTGFTLSMTGMALSKLGQGMFLPIDAFTKSAGETNPVSAEWLRTQKELEQSTIRIGASLAREALPAMKQISAVAGKVAGMIEANPALAKAAVGVGAALSVGGTMLMVVGQVMSSISAMKALMILIKESQAATAAGKVAGTGAAVAGGAAATAAGASGGLLAAIVALGAIFQSIPGKIGAELGKKIGSFQAAQQLLTIGANKLGGALGGPETARKWTLAIGQLTGAISKADAVTRAAAGTFGKAGITREMVDAFINYKEEELRAAQQYRQQSQQIREEARRAEAEANRNYTNQRSQINSQFSNEEAAASRNHSQQLAAAQRELWQEEARAQADYYRQRSELVADYNEQEVQAEAEHQRRIRQMMEDYNAKIESLADARDALGMLREMQAYERDRQRAEEDFGAERGKRAAELQSRLAEMDQQYQAEKAKRMADAQARIAELNAQYAAERSQRAQARTQQLSELDAQHKSEIEQIRRGAKEKQADLTRTYNQETADRKKAFDTQLRDLGAFGEKETRLKQQYYEQQARLLEQYIKGAGGSGSGSFAGVTGSASSTPAADKNKPQRFNPLQAINQMLQDLFPGRAAGGYVNEGLYKLHDDEYVLNPATVSALERLGGGRRLSQNLILGLARGGGSGSVTYNDHRRFDSRLSAEDRRMIQQDTMSMLSGAFNA